MLACGFPVPLETTFSSVEVTAAAICSDNTRTGWLRCW